jgi:small subunit ribosomal protein S14
MNKFKRYYIIRKDILRRKIFYKYEKIRLFLKFIKLNKRILEINNNIDIVDKFNFYFLLKCLIFKKSLISSTIRNKCLITGRSRSIYRDFRLSRMQLRHLASFGYLMGIKKSSW